MKKVITILLFVFALITMHGQNINWAQQEAEKPNSLTSAFSYDFGMTFQLGYGRYLDVIKPVQLNMDISVPLGIPLIDDFKIRYGAQAELLQYKNFAASFKLMGNIINQETRVVKILDFGMETTLTAGFYRPSWHIALECGINKPILANLNHSKSIRDFYPEIYNGWIYSTGGYFTYTLHGGKSIGSSMNLSLSLGLTDAFGNDKNATLPYFGQLGVSKKF